ncbi:MAG TPA: hypothetical protein VF800_02570 [Telluria sp.]
MLTILAVAWAAWAGANLAALILAALLVRPNQPCFNGFKIVMPAWLGQVLTPAEVVAVLEHERGHRRHLHIWTNLALTCCFVSISVARHRRLEFEADDYAARGGHAPALASALDKMSAHRLDIERAERLRNLYP